MVNLIFIGPPKSGSTWLFEIFKAHPDIYVTPSKETYFFDKNYWRGTAWYYSHFHPSREKWVAEICHDYIYDKTVPQKIKETLGVVKIMIFLRDPVDWIRSGYLFSKRNGNFSGPISKFIKSRPEMLNFKYGTVLESYIDTFGPENLLVYLYDDLQKDSTSLANKIFSDLGVGELKYPEVTRNRINPASKPRIKLAARIVKLTSKHLRSLGLNKTIAFVKSFSFVRYMLYKEISETEKTAALDFETARILQDVFREDIQQIDRLLGTNCKQLWRYD